MFRLQRTCPVRLGGLFVIAACLQSMVGAQVTINEIHFDPPDKTLSEEFIEVYNAGADEDLSGWFFSEGVFYEFPPGSSIGPGQYLVIAEDPAEFEAKFGFPPDHGPYSGRLSNDGERLTLRNEFGDLVDAVDYQVAFPWPTASGGRGSSMELLHPDLDNNLGGSWRASGYNTDPPIPPTFYLTAQSSGWRYRKGLSEPPADWRSRTFIEDGTWSTGTTSIGYGDNDDSTTLGDMQGNYSTVYLRKTFDIDDPADVSSDWKLRVYVDDGCVVWINGNEVSRLFVPGGTLAFNALASNHEASWDEVDLPDPESILVAGTNVIAIHAVNQALGSSDFSIDASILVPGSEAQTFADPSPGAVNTIFEANSAPQTRQVAHLPRSPTPSESVVVSAKVTDPEGVATVRLSYQIVEPGSYVPSLLPHPHSVLLGDPTRLHDPNPEFEDPNNWLDALMVDDGSGGDAFSGDDIYSVTLPPQSNRALVRYRVEVTDSLGATAIVPYVDDRSRNFAYFVYEGVPAYRAETRTVQPGGPPFTYSEAVMNGLPSYHVITRPEDWTHCFAYDGSLQIPKSNENGRDEFNWQCTFVYNGVVYDHVRYRLRQANDRYGGRGKRSMRFRFNKGNHLQPHDRDGRPYPTRWRTLNTGKMFDNKDVGNFGLTETMNSHMWNLMGVPAPFVHTFQMRVIRQAAEAPAGTNGQYYGDFNGIHLAFEDYHSLFLEAHGLDDGNLYKLKDQIFDGTRVRRHQGKDAVTSDVDFQNIRNNLRPERDLNWLLRHVRYKRWYPYHTICEAIRHYDFRPADSHLKNRAWFFEPVDGSGTGRLWTLPHDSDASWGPNWNSGVDYSKNAIFAAPGKPTLRQEYRNVIREFRDLLWTPEVIRGMIDDLAATVHDLSDADRDRWRSAPADAGAQDFGPIETKVQDMKNFAFVSWSGSTGPTVPAGGRAAHLDQLANAEGDGSSLPNRPTVTSVGPGSFPADDITFRTSSFSDPQGSGTFAGLKWRIGKITDPSAPAYDPAAPIIYEVPAVWESEEIFPFAAEVTPPPVLEVGHTFRARCKMLDTSGRWSHWSSPLEFTVTAPTAPSAIETDLRVTELMFNPLGGSDFEFIEMRNVGTTPLDLTYVSFTDGVEFSFAEGAVTTLDPGEFVVVVRNLTAFQVRYDVTDLNIAGEYRGRFANDGEIVSLSLANGRTITSFSYLDSWYPATDGAGSSLQLLDEESPPENLSTEEAWFASPLLFGTPGLPFDGEPPSGGFRLPGDGNGDERLDISDAFWLLRALFPGPNPPALPCSGASVQDGGNRDLMDVNGNDDVDITDVLHILNFLFQLGPAPAGGTTCVRIDGCTPSCSF